MLAYSLGQAVLRANTAIRSHTSLIRSPYCPVAVVLHHGMHRQHRCRSSPATTTTAGATTNANINTMVTVPSGLLVVHKPVGPSRCVCV